MQPVERRSPPVSPRPWPRHVCLRTNTVSREVRPSTPLRPAALSPEKLLIRAAFEEAPALDIDGSRVHTAGLGRAGASSQGSATESTPGC